MTPNGHIDDKENNPYLDSHFLKAKGDDSHEIILTNEMGFGQV